MGVGMRSRLWTCSALALFFLCGCADIPSVEGPAPAFKVKEDRAALDKIFGPATSIDEYYKGKTGDNLVEGDADRPARDRFIAGRLVAYDLAYADWASQFALDKAEIDSILDITGLALGITTGIAGGREDKAILGGVSSLLSGSRLSIEKNFYDQKTVHVLIAQMNAQRKAALVPIMQGLTKSPKDYPLTRALVDLQAYYMAGTLEGALQGIQEEAASTDARASLSLKNIDQYRQVSFGADDSSKAILLWLYPNAATFDKLGKAFDKNGAAVALDQERARKWNDWVDKNYPGLLPETLRVAPALADARKQAVKELGIGP